MCFPPRSEMFDDVYFSVENGLAETRHVFLQGNNLPNAWSGRERFVICETGFGTGLNFVAVWDMFEKHSQPEQTLHFVSFEKFPLDKTTIHDALVGALSQMRDSHGDNQYEPYIESLLKHYPITIPGYHRVVLNNRVILTVIFDDINRTIPTLNTPVDCWFLDGFKPATNPDMWSETVFQNMARLSHKATTFATFTAAGFVRRGLQDVNFVVQKQPGFGRKREMLTGVYNPSEG